MWPVSGAGTLGERWTVGPGENIREANRRKCMAQPVLAVAVPSGSTGRKGCVRPGTQAPGGRVGLPSLPGDPCQRAEQGAQAAVSGRVRRRPLQRREPICGGQSMQLSKDEWQRAEPRPCTCHTARSLRNDARPAPRPRPASQAVLRPLSGYCMSFRNELPPPPEWVR